MQAMIYASGSFYGTCSDNPSISCAVPFFPRVNRFFFKIYHQIAFMLFDIYNRAFANSKIELFARYT